MKEERNKDLLSCSKKLSISRFLRPKGFGADAVTSEICVQHAVS